MPPEPLFLLGLALILTHEVDAVDRREWRIFFPGLPDRTAVRLFIALHVPLFAALLWGLLRPGGPAPGLIVGLDLFFIAHVGAHLLALRHPENRFTDAFSWSFIAGAGAAGLIDLLLRVAAPVA